MKNQYLTKIEIDSLFATEYLPSIREDEKAAGFKDKSLRCETYNNLVDSLQKDGRITESQSGRYCIPKRYL